MNYPLPERLLFVVAVDKSELENQPKLKELKTQIAQNNGSAISQIQMAIQGEPALADKVKLLTLDNYLTIFAGVIEVDSAVIQPAPGKVAHWQTEATFVQSLLQAIFSGADADLTWTLLRVSELCAEQVDSFSLLGMKGIGSRG